MPASSKITVCLVSACLALCLQACKHPLAIVGEGDIVDANNSGRGCTLEQFQARDVACTENAVSGDYLVNYRAQPRPGWRFVRWEGPCSPTSEFQHCSSSASQDIVAWWDATYPGAEIQASTAVFQPIAGETGFLSAGAPVAGVVYETATQRGVTGLDGSFQYEEGEKVRFFIGDTTLGEVVGQKRITPFELADSPVLTGIAISWALGESPFPEPPRAAGSNLPNFGVGTLIPPDPFNTVVNIAVLLQSLDEDADAVNGIVIRPGVAALFNGVYLDLRQEWERFLVRSEPSGYPETYPTLHHQLVLASKSRRFSRAHGIVNPAHAMQRLYEGLGIDPSTYATCPKSPGLPGNIDSDLKEEDLYCQYDADGNLTVLDGVSYEYDYDGRVTGSRRGAQVESVKYNAYGDRVLYTRDNNGDGIFEFIERWRYDASGNLIRHDLNLSAHGMEDWAESWMYDMQGRPKRYMSQWLTWNWRYDVDNYLIRFEEEQFSDTATIREQVRTWQYDQTGRVLSVEEEERTGLATGNHRVETRSDEYTYGEDGTLIRARYTREGEQQPVLRWIEEYAFNANGDLTRFEYDQVSAGGPTLVDTWEYDINGNMIRHLFRVMPAGGEESGEAEYLEYDTEGRLTRYEHWRDSQGLPDAIETWQYDTAGNLVLHEIEHDSGELQFEHWQYRQDGALERYERNFGYFGFTGEVRSWEYSATGWGHLFRKKRTAYYEIPD